MIRTVSFTLNVVPHTATNQTGGKRLGKKVVGSVVDGKYVQSTKPTFFKDEQTRQIEKDYLTLLAFHRPKAPLVGPLRLEILICFPWHKSESKENLEAGEVWHDTKPDCGNWTKTFEDCMEKAGYFENDSRIVYSITMKRRGEKPRIMVRLCEIDPSEWNGAIALDPIGYKGLK